MSRPARRLLVVDDYPSGRKLLRAVLEGAGHTVLEASDGQEALELLDRESVDAVVSDVLMPRLDGYRLCFRVRQDPRLRDLPFIVHTATYTSPADEKLSLELGATRYLRKPASATELLETVEAAIAEGGRRPQGEGAALDEVGVMREYGEQLVAKLEEKNVELERANAELRESEQRFRDLAEHIQDVFYSFDPAGNRLLYVSPAYEAIYGRSCRSLYDDPLTYRDAIHPDDRPIARAALRGQAAGEPTDSEYRVLHPDGSVRWVRDRSWAVPGAPGVSPHVVGVVKEITDRKEAEERLRASEAQYRMLFEQNPHPMWVYDVATLRFLAVNAAAVEQYGYSREEFLEMSILDLRPPENAAALDDTQATRRYDRKRHVLRSHRRKDGSILRVEVTADDLALEGRAARLVLAEDVTERERQADQVREQASLLDKARDAILVRDLAHRVTYWNKGAERLYGWTAQEAFGRAVTELLYRDDAGFREASAAVLADGEWMGELPQVARDGRALTVEARWTLVRDADGEPASILAINTDVTERRLLEQQFLRAQRLESLGTLAGGIAHDLNNVLAPIMMSIDLLKEGALDAESQALLETIGASAQRGAEMVKRVLSFARGMGGRRVEVDVGELLRDLARIVRDTFPKSIRLELSAPSGLPSVAGDPTQLHQVLLNLCVNARDAMPGGGLLVIAAVHRTLDEAEAVAFVGTAPGDYVCVEIADTGSGIAPEDLDRIFDPFFTTKEVGQGTGLGLSTSIGIVKQHGGVIRVESELGRGSRFRVYLPAAAATGDARGDRGVAELPRGAGETVLLVDDEAAILRVVRQALEAYGYRVVAAADGAEALALFAELWREIDVVVTDTVMPGLDGMALIRSLRASNPDIRVLATSGLAPEGTAEQALAAGASRFLAKPFTNEALLRELRHLLSGAG